MPRVHEGTASDAAAGVVLMQAAIAGALSKPQTTVLSFRGRTTRAGRFAAAVATATADLAHLGAAPGSAIALMLPPSPATVIYALAALSLGATLVPFDPDAPVASIAACLTKHPVDLLITADLDPLHTRALETAQRAAVPTVFVVSYTAMVSRLAGLNLRVFHAHLLARAPPPSATRHVLERDLRRDRARADAKTAPTAAPPLSGTIRLHTMRDGGVTETAHLTLENLAATTAQLTEQLQPLIQALRAQDARILSALPLYHPLTLAVPLGLSLAASAELIVLPDTTPHAVADAIHRRDPTVLIAAPVHLAHLTADSVKARKLLSAVRLILVVAGQASPTLRADLAKATAAPVLDLLLLPVVGTVLAITDASEGAPMSAARALPLSRVSVRDGADLAREVSCGERGELCVSGPHIPAPEQVSSRANRYLGNALRTGDLGSLDGNGRLFVADAVDDLIVARGYLIFPRRIEAALKEHPGVRDAAVHGVSSAAHDQTPRATVVLRRAAVVTERDLMAHLESRVSRIELPSGIDFAQSLPLTPFGAVDKDALRRG